MLKFYQIYSRARITLLLEENKQQQLSLTAMLRKPLAFSEKFEKISFIGRGAFVRDRNSFKQYAAKVISLNGMTHSQILKADEERLIHSRLSHPNILKFMQSYLQDDDLIFVMEFCQYGDLHAFIQKRKEDNRHKMPEEVIMNILIQLLYGLQYLHNQGIVHRDIKPSNIFVDSRGAAKIADFGISKVLNPSSSINLSIHQMDKSKKLHVSGTPLYLSPQSCRNEQITFKSDVWSLGCVLYQLCTLKRAFEADNILALATKINSEEIKSIGGSYSEDLSALVRWMLNKVPENRPQIWQILGLTFVKKYIKAFENKKQNKYQTPKKMSIGTFYKDSPSSATTDCSPPYKIIERQAFLNESQIINDHESQSIYYSQLRHSCHNLLGGEEQFAQMYNQIKQLTEQITIVNEKDRNIFQCKLKTMYGDDYFDISKAMLELVQYEKKPSKHF